MTARMQKRGSELRYRERKPTVRAVSLLAMAGSLLVLSGCSNDEDSMSSMKTATEGGRELTTRNREDWNPDYWQNPECFTLKLVADRTELRVGEEISLHEVLTNVGEQDRYLEITGWVRHALELSVWHGEQNQHWKRRKSTLILDVYPEPTTEGFVFLREPADITYALGGDYPWSIPPLQQNLFCSSGWVQLLRAKESITDNNESVRVQIPGQYLIRAQWWGRLHDRPPDESSRREPFKATSHWILLTVRP